MTPSRAALLAALVLFATGAGATPLQDAFQLIGDRVALIVQWSRNILFTVVVGGVMWSLVGWIGTGRIQLKPVLITLSAGLFLGIAQGLLEFFVDLDQIRSETGALPSDRLENLLQSPDGGSTVPDTTP